MSSPTAYITAAKGLTDIIQTADQSEETHIFNYIKDTITPMAEPLRFERICSYK